MNIRPATPEDKPQIIELLKSSLGESMIPKSEALWNWKHEANPFGASYVLVAEEEGQLIGLRAFMQWQWLWKGETFRAIRAVDTATHPAHQGKGIFKKLTLQQLAICQKEGVHFVFNTPNEKSKPGYLKMGWVEQGKMPLKFRVRNPFTLAFAKVFNKTKYPQTGDPTPAQNWDAAHVEKVQQYKPLPQFISTDLTPAYINWRYATNPLFRYNFITDNQHFILITRIKNHGFTKELRLVDFILLQPGDAKRISKSIEKGVEDFCTANSVNLISFSGVQFEFYKPYFNWMGIVPVKPLGPIVTLKGINMNDRFPELLQVSNWGYSLGDMELF